MKLTVAVIITLTLAGCFAWEADVERGGYRFSQYRLDRRAKVHIGILKTDAAVDGFVCQGGGWAHFRSDWSLEACFLGEPYVTEHVTIPVGTWIRPQPDRLIVAFAEDTPCQGYVCTGSGGTKGTHTTFYPNGRLSAFFPPDNITVSGVVCKASPFANVQLHPNGELKSCVAAADGSVAGAPFQAGDKIVLDETGAPRFI